MDSPPPIECACGSQNFERVVVKRLNGKPHRTEFIACTECRVMYYSPQTRAPEADDANKAWLRMGGST